MSQIALNATVLDIGEMLPGSIIISFELLVVSLRSPVDEVAAQDGARDGVAAAAVNALERGGIMCE